jgi:hypothetical protein
MASTKMTEPNQIPEVILDSDSEQSENDNNETVDNEEHCEQLQPD